MNEYAKEPKDPFYPPAMSPPPRCLHPSFLPANKGTAVKVCLGVVQSMHTKEEKK